MSCITDKLRRGVYNKLLTFYFLLLIWLGSLKRDWKNMSTKFQVQPASTSSKNYYLGNSSHRQKGSVNQVNFFRVHTKNSNHFSRTFQGLFKDHIRFFQGQPTRNIISQIVQKCIFPVYSNRTLRLELFASPTSLHFSVHLSYS